MRTAAILLLLGLLSVSAIGQETPDIERAFAKALIAEKEGRHEAAIKAFYVVVTEWPEDTNHTPQAWVHIGKNLAELGRFGQALRVLDDAREGYEKRSAAAALLDKARDEVQDTVVRHHRDVKDNVEDVEQRLEELKRIWKAQGFEAAEIEERIKRAREDFERVMLAKKTFEKQVEKLRAAGLEGEDLERQMEEIHKRLTAEEEEHWRERHDDEMQEARREFLKLAEHLGIPPEEAEGLLEKHHRRGPGRHFEPPKVDVAVIEKRLHEIEAHLGHLMKEVGKVVEELHHRIGHLEESIGKVHDEAGPRLKEMEERIRRLEEKLRDREK